MNDTRFRVEIMILFIDVFQSVLITPQSIYFTDIAGCDEGVNLVLVDVFHQIGELIGREEYYKFYFVFSGVAASNIIHGHTT